MAAKSFLPALSRRRLGDRIIFLRSLSNRCPIPPGGLIELMAKSTAWGRWFNSSDKYRDANMK